MIVVDTNIIAYFYIKGDNSALVEKLAQLEPHWVAPVLWRSEFRNVLALYIRQSKLNVSQAIWLMENAVNQMAGNEFDVPTYKILTLVAQSSCSAYDCEFVALAQILSTVLVTMDKRILRSFPDWTLHPRDFIGH